ncbi:ABC transporter ATP-binding protein [Paenibacillus hemerocallicola]|uniref:ABC transporter ATP-binding protein n=1 Tax=Paenibacillus hemerocallicola TaxID=1172614 RepID=A0A5C4T271_9BACL|nr:ABC transporter ATP-binding protein [Paenibacillus hemerocallicola]TNJ62915.1 ABC transporter ATP-binding protein [Paenibacillus hemerocallicola]
MDLYSTRSRTFFVLRRLSPHKAKVAVLFSLILVGIGLQVYSPRYVQLFIDQAKEGKGSSVLMMSAFLFFGLTALRQIASVAVQVLAGDITWTVTNRLRLELTRLCLERDWQFHEKHAPGELVERIDGDVGKLNNFLSAFILKVIGNHLLIIAIAAAILLIHPVIGAVVIVLSVIALYVLHRMGNYGTAAVRGYLAESAEMLGYLDERITGREDIRALDANSFALASYYRGLRRLYRTRKQTGSILATSLNTADVTLAAILSGSILCIGLLTLRNADLSLGTVFLVYYYITLLLVPLRNIVYEISDLQQAGAALQRIGELLDEEDRSSPTGVRIGEFEGLSVRFDNVTFGYEETKPVIRNFNLDLPPNRTIGIIGRSGSGKSTIAKLLFRSCEAQQGMVSINGTDIRRIDADSLLTLIAYVPQSVELFEGTLRDNVTMFDATVGDELIWETFRMLRMDEWARRFADGLDTTIDRDGMNVSAGEAQLIASARAFLKRPKLVILDEATSRIDPDTESATRQAIEELMRDRTVVIIAHKLSTVANTDFLLVMRDGKAVEFGETRLLADDPSSEYARMRKKAGGGG